MQSMLPSIPGNPLLSLIAKIRAVSSLVSSLVYSGPKTTQHIVVEVLVRAIHGGAYLGDNGRTPWRRCRCWWWRAGPSPRRREAVEVGGGGGDDWREGRREREVVEGCWRWWRRRRACWENALEAIINWFIKHIHVYDNGLLSMLKLY